MSDTRAHSQRIIQLSAGTADDGGPAQLTILIDTQYDEERIVQVTQLFDTLYSVVYFDSGYEKGETREGIAPFSWSFRETSGGDPQP